MKHYQYPLYALCIWGLSGVVPVMASSDTTDLELDLTEDVLFEDIESVYSASKYDQKVTDAPARISIVTASEIQRYSNRT